MVGFPQIINLNINILATDAHLLPGFRIFFGERENMCPSFMAINVIKMMFLTPLALKPSKNEYILLPYQDQD